MRQRWRKECGCLLPLKKELNTRNARYQPRDSFQLTALMLVVEGCDDRGQELNFLCKGRAFLLSLSALTPKWMLTVNPWQQPINCLGAFVSKKELTRGNNWGESLGEGKRIRGKEVKYIFWDRQLSSLEKTRCCSLGSNMTHARTVDSKELC